MFNFNPNNYANTTGGGTSFLSKPAPAPASAPTLNAPNATTAPSLFNFSGGAPTINALPTIAQPVTGIPFPKETLFGDLPRELASNLELIEAKLRQAGEQSGSLSALCESQADPIGSIATEISELEERLTACEAANATCRGQIATAKTLLNQYWRYGESVARTILASRQSATDGSVRWVPVITPADLGLLEELVLRLEGQIGELSDLAAALERQLQHLGRVDAGPRADLLRETLRSQHCIFLGVTNKVAFLQTELDGLRDTYKLFLAKYRNDLRDPFVPRQAVANQPLAVANRAVTGLSLQPNSLFTQGSSQTDRATNQGPVQGLGQISNHANIQGPSLQNPSSNFLNNKTGGSSLFSFPTTLSSFSLPASKRGSLPSQTPTTNPFLQTPR